MYIFTTYSGPDHGANKGLKLACVVCTCIVHVCTWVPKTKRYLTHVAQMQVLISSSAAGQCGATATCDASVPVTDISLTFSNSTVLAGDEVGVTLSMLVTVPVAESQTIDIGLQGFTATNLQSDFAFDTASFEADPLFSVNELPLMPAWMLLGCIKDDLTGR
jgi:hypothetical protein